MTAQEHLENFLQAFYVKDQKFEELKKFLTLTQQNECLYVDRVSVEGSLMGINQLLKMADRYEIKAIPNSNKVMKDFVIHLFKQDTKELKKTKLQCRLVKEIEVRKTGESGVWGWGVNSSSFKHVG